VLLVEDDKAARRALSWILQIRGFAVSEAGSVAEARRHMADGPQWVLLDLMLPDGNGIDVLRDARRSATPAKVCVISGCSAEKLDEARRLGAEDALTKPLNIDYLLGILSA
jgi:DNA-binding response OmpR family regulator